MSEPSDEQIAHHEDASVEALQSTTASNEAGAAFEETTTSALEAGKARRATLEVSDAELRRGLQSQLIKQARQANKLRKRFARWVARPVTVVIGAGILVIGLYIWSQWGDLKASVLIAWFSADIIQTVGLAYIVARYLVPSPHSPLVEPGPPGPGSAGL